MKDLQITHYDKYTFELSYTLNDVYHLQDYVEVDQIENILYGLPSHLEAYEDTIKERIFEDYEDIIEIQREKDEQEYNAHVADVKNYFWG